MSVLKCALCITVVLTAICVYRYNIDVPENFSEPGKLKVVMAVFKMLNDVVSIQQG